MLKNNDMLKVSRQIKYALVLSILCLAGLNFPARAGTAIETQGFKIQVFLDKEPLKAETKTVVTVKVLRAKDLAPVVGQPVYTSIIGTNLEPGQKNKGRTDAFGNFEFQALFGDAGLFKLKVELPGSKAMASSKGILTVFPLKIAPRGHPGLKLIFILVLLLGTTIAGMVLIRVKIKNPDKSVIDLLDIPIIQKILKARYFQDVIQIVLLIFLFIFIFLAFFDIQDSARNLSVIVIWTIWWAGVIFTFVLAGRLWCFMCPVGAVSEWISRASDPQMVLPKSLQNMWFANTFFVLLTWLDIQIGVVRNPLVTGFLLSLILVVAAVFGLFYQKRTFCRHICPIGGLIGIYSLFSPIELRSKDLEICKRHKRKDCYLGNSRGRGCPMFEMVPEIDSNKACNFCGECIKSCPKNNISIRIRPFFKDAWTTKKKSLDDAVFAVVLVGVAIFVTGDMLEPWTAWMQSAIKWFPAGFFGIHYQYTIEVVTKSLLYFFISIFLIPGIIFLCSAISNHLAGKKNHHGLKQTFISFGFMFIPVGLSMHLAHNIGHLLNESVLVIPALKRTINKYLPFSAGEPNWQIASVSMVDPLFVYWIQMILFLIFYGFSLVAGYKLAMKNYTDPQTGFRALLPMMFIAGILMAVNVYLLNLPMSPRHIH
ncbi:MAG: 4Fe-4S binding protein [Deltaproteobacteria bacterium]|nr:4Fe-4S binding protein [Deltaproteobacteria bacterium]